MSCDEIQELLSDLIDDELSAGARSGVEAHVASCERCAGAYRALKRTVRFVRSNADPELLPGTPGGNYLQFTRGLMDADRPRGRRTEVIDRVFPDLRRTDGGAS